MGKLTYDQWSELRAEWEASPRQGIEWLSKDHGGSWNLTAEAIRRRRIKDGEQGDPWVKPTDMGNIVRRARLMADAGTALLAGQAPIGAEGLLPEESIDPAHQVGAQERFATSSGAGDDAAVDLRARLIETHRKEWRVARGLAVRAIQEAAGVRGFRVAQFAKILTEILTTIQAGERKAWGLDADLLDLEGMTDAQLRAIAHGKVAR